MRILKFVLLLFVFIGTPALITHQGQNAESKKILVDSVKQENKYLAATLGSKEEIDSLTREIQLIKYQADTFIQNEKKRDLERDLQELNRRKNDLENRNKTLTNENEDLKKRIKVLTADPCGDDINRGSFHYQKSDLPHLDIDRASINSREQRFRDEICQITYNSNNVNDLPSKRKNREAIKSEILRFFDLLEIDRKSIKRLYRDIAAKRRQLESDLGYLRFVTQCQRSNQVDTYRLEELEEIDRQISDNIEALDSENRVADELLKSIEAQFNAFDKLLTEIESTDNAAFLKSRPRLGETAVFCQFCEVECQNNEAEDGGK